MVTPGDRVGLQSGGGALHMRCMMMLGAALLLAPMGGALAQNAEAGQQLFNDCRTCHTINRGGRSGIGPNLHGIWNRAAAQRENFRYSPSMREKAAGGLTWNEATLGAYLRNPKEVVPDGSMAFPGLGTEQQISDILAYIRQASGAN
jgi:cytochrome c